MNNVKPTKLQKATLTELKNDPSLSLGEAMRKAGYSEKTALNPKANFVGAPGTKAALSEWRGRLEKVGITQDFLAKKYAEWIDATKIKTSMTEPDKIVPDYQTQLKAGEFVRKDFGLEQEPDINIDAKILVLPAELLEKHGITPDTEDSGS